MFISGNAETMIIIFISVCAALIVFDILCAVYIRNRDLRVKKIADSINEVKTYLNNPKKLYSEEILMAVEACMDRLSETDPNSYLSCKKAAAEAFSKLLHRRRWPDDIVRTYVVFLAAKYRLFYHTSDDTVKTELLFMTDSDRLFIRETALYCIGSTEDEMLIRAARERHVSETGSNVMNPPHIREGM